MAGILVIDDQLSVLQLLVDISESAGHEVVTATDGRTGPDLYTRQSPALVITDLLIPRRPGTLAPGFSNTQAT